MAWHPIESVPKDRPVLVGYWQNGGWHLVRARWKQDQFKAGWWSVGGWTFYGIEPTHWHEDVGTPARPPMFKRAAGAP